MRSLLAVLLVPTLACSSPSSPARVQEAGTDSPADSADDSCFPLCGSGSSSGGGDDGGDASCAELKGQVDQLQGAAQACNPQQQNQCTGVVQGICCPVTVTAGNDQAANAYQQAVNHYESTCDAGCLTPVCPTAPSLSCQSTQPTQPSQGLCR